MKIKTKVKAGAVAIPSSGMSENPIYSDNGLSGTNPLFIKD
jgi:hypothetical protein